MSAPVLDAAYMQAVRQRAYWQAMSDIHRRPDTVASLREEYARGRIDYTEFERRLERLLKCA